MCECKQVRDVYMRLLRLGYRTYFASLQKMKVLTRGFYCISLKLGKLVKPVMKDLDRVS